jgi:pyruvate kinase
VIRTKIICTVGPASKSPETLRQMMNAGMDVARLNASHGTHEEHLARIVDIRRLADELGRPIAILLDLAGAKVRTGKMAAGSVTLEAGAKFILTGRDVPGSQQEVSLTYKTLPREVHPGDSLLLADGAIELVVEEANGEDILTRVINGGELSSSKGINLPTRTISAPTLTEKDKRDLAFGLENGVDFVGLSFVRTAADVLQAREIIERSGHRAQLIAKIEKHEAVDRFDEIVAVVDAIMIARGDLGVEIPIERVPRVQKELIRKANRAGKPVITATQMLKSMVESPRPTRAEATDVANAVLDGSDAIMLSEETAIGANPVGAVSMMARIAASAEEIFPFVEWGSLVGGESNTPFYDALARSAAQIAEDIDAAAIVAFTQSGSTARLLAKQRPRQPILAPTPIERTYRQLALTWGVLPIKGEATENVNELEAQACRLAQETGFVKPGDRVVITAGIPLGKAGTTNLIKVAGVE